MSRLCLRSGLYPPVTVVSLAFNVDNPLSCCPPSGLYRRVTSPGQRAVVLLLPQRSPNIDDFTWSAPDLLLIWPTSSSSVHKFIESQMHVRNILIAKSDVCFCCTDWLNFSTGFLKRVEFLLCLTSENASVSFVWPDPFPGRRIVLSCRDHQFSPIWRSWRADSNHPAADECWPLGAVWNTLTYTSEDHFTGW